MDETRGERITRLREAKGLTIEELAEKCGVTYAAVYKWETAGLDPIDIRNETLGLLCIALGTDLPYMLWGADRKPKSAPVQPASAQRRRRKSD